MSKIGVKPLQMLTPPGSRAVNWSRRCHTWPRASENPTGPVDMAASMVCRTAVTCISDNQGP